MSPPISSISRGGGASKSKSVSFSDIPVADDDVEVTSRKRSRVSSTSSVVDEETEDVFGVDTTYDEGGTTSFQAVVKSSSSRRARKRRDDDDDEDGEEDVDASYSLLYEEDPLTRSSTTSTIPVEAFNLNEERNGGDGYFDGDMYVFRRRKDDNEDDAWLQSMQDQQPLHDQGRTNTTIVGKDGNDESEDSDDDDDESVEVSPDKLLEKAKLIQEILTLLLTPKETVSDAMRRYGHIHAQRSAKENVAFRNNGNNAKQCLQKLAKLANQLVMEYFENDVYDKSAQELQLWHEVLIAGQQESQASPLPEQPSMDMRMPVQWEYCGQDNNMHGPFSTEQMLQWTRQGYFLGESVVRMRKVRSLPTEEEKKATAVHDLMADLEDSDQEDNDEKQENCEDQWMMSDQIDFQNCL